MFRFRGDVTDKLLRRMNTSTEQILSATLQEIRSMRLELELICLLSFTDENR